MVFTIPFCMVLRPTGLSGAAPGVYKDQTSVLHLDTFSAFTDIFEVYGWSMAPMARTGPSPYTVGILSSRIFWLVILGKRSGVFYNEELMLIQLNESPPEYRAAYGFDSFKSALICQMSRSNIQYRLVTHLPNNLTTPTC
ncbi:hypothetical protein IW262DRAFT_1467418 [Armillaria fumosa]|nr:hypothetical protein IW262DRAFT_1467418 [Armillaria fumosa]